LYIAAIVLKLSHNQTIILVQMLIWDVLI